MDRVDCKLVNESQSMHARHDRACGEGAQRAADLRDAHVRERLRMPTARKLRAFCGVLYSIAGRSNWQLSRNAFLTT
jgi:hypothetical protein